MEINTKQTKTCKCCNEILNIDKFYLKWSTNSKKFYYQNDCRKCVNKRRSIQIKKRRIIYKITRPDYLKNRSKKGNDSFIKKYPNFYKDRINKISNWYIMTLLKDYTPFKNFTIKEIRLFLKKNPNFINLYKERIKQKRKIKSINKQFKL